MVNSSTMTLIVIVMAIYFVGMIAISWMGRKYGKNFDDFISAGRNCTTLMIIGSAVGSHIGNGYVVGGAASGAAVGLSGAWYGIGCALSYLAVAFVLNHRVYKCGSRNPECPLRREDDLCHFQRDHGALLYCKHRRAADGRQGPV